jgi:hypothetical protein
LGSQIKQHAPTLKVVIYDGLKALKGYKNDGGGASSKKKAWRKMSREDRFKIAQVCFVAAIVCYYIVL